MATHGERDRRSALVVALKEPSFRAAVSKKDRDGKHAGPRPHKAAHHHSTNGKSHVASSNHGAADGNGSERGAGAVSFSTNHNSVVCLPLVSEGLKLVWTQSDQTRELDAIPELVQAFNVFPYPTLREVSTLARLCTLPLDKVKVWFMVQRIKYGISWASEEIEETRRKLAGPERVTEGEEEEARKRKNGCEEFPEDDNNDDNNGDDEDTEGAFPCSPRKRPKYESPEPAKLPPFVPQFRSSLPPPQDSYYYRHPVDTPAATVAAAASPGSLESPLSSPQQRQGRYKKSKAQLAVLRSSFLRENWPAEAELRRLQEETGLSRNDIRKWFSDSRYQLRNGRGGPGLTSPPAAARGAKSEPRPPPPAQPQQLHALPLVAHGPRHPQNGIPAKGGARGKAPRSNGVTDTFFQNFLSNSLEVFGDGVEEDEVSAEEASVEKTQDEGEVQREEEEEEEEEDDDDDDDEVESEEEQPLKLSTDCSELEALPALSATISSSSSSSSPPPSPSGTLSPASAALPHKRSSTSNGSSQKSARSAKAAPSGPSSTSPSSSSNLLTAAGRPRKTKEQLDVLKQHFLSCQWPKSEDYTRLVEVTALPRADVIQWFGDTRYAVKNGQLRWVRGVREQILAEIALQQNGGGGTGANGQSGTPKGGGSRKRKSQVNGATKTPTSAADSPDIQPLELYHRQTGELQEKDLDTLCRKSRMSYRQVRDWFASQESEAASADSELNVTD